MAAKESGMQIRGKVSIFSLIIFLTIMFGCFETKDKADDDDNENGGGGNTEYRVEMRTFVSEISDYAKTQKPGFFIIPQNGVELFTLTGDHEGEAAAGYLSKIDGTGQEDLFYGYDEDDAATPAEEMEWIKGFLDIGKANNITIMVTDYCSTHSNMDDSYAKSAAAGYISFAADSRDLDTIPAYPAVIHNENSTNVTSMAMAKNFLYLINPSNYSTKSAMLSAISATNYDIVLIDAFFNEQLLSSADIASLKTKKNGGTRLVICYMSIGEAEDYRYYWDENWSADPPAWLTEENPDWEGNFKVRYWQREWKDIIYGSSDAYLDKILSCGFDGVYLDIIDAFEYFEGE